MIKSVFHCFSKQYNDFFFDVISYVNKTKLKTETNIQISIFSLFTLPCTIPMKGSRQTININMVRMEMANYSTKLLQMTGKKEAAHNNSDVIWCNSFR